jgi:anti-sigma regulatory factor (Ser/Thr protein kinase)
MTTAPASEISTLTLEATDRAPWLARRFLAAHFRKWKIGGDYVARVVVSELVTNAYQHAVGPITVRIFLDQRDGRPVIEVQDQGEATPTIRPENHLDESGRGMVAVETLVETWGVRPIPEGGKVVWAKCRS